MKLIDEFNFISLGTIKKRLACNDFGFGAMESPEHIVGTLNAFAQLVLTKIKMTLK